MMKKSLISAAIMAAALVSCSHQDGTTRSGLDPEKFVSEVGGKQTALYTLANGSGMEVCITNFGGRIVSILVPGKDGRPRDVVLAYDNIESFTTQQSDFGASVGRYANRIGDARFTLEGVEYQLPRNNFSHCLHGGPTGWQYQVYDAVQTDGQNLELTIVSPDGDNNFPGTVTAKVHFTLTDDNAIDIRYSATTDKPTVINMTNHSYFNLSGDPSNPATDHVLYLNADRNTPPDSTSMTTGEIQSVLFSPLDFTKPKPIAPEVLNFEYEPIRNACGFDHNWVLNTAGDISRVAASLYSPVSGIKLEVYTNEPGIQFYSGNYLDGSDVGKKGISYGPRAGVCLETQHYPDSPNKPDWPSTTLLPGQEYFSECIYKFSVE